MDMLRLEAIHVDVVISNMQWLLLGEFLSVDFMLIDYKLKEHEPVFRLA